MENQVFDNPILEKMMSHRSVRRFDPDYVISDDDITTIIRAGQQASTSCTGQMYTIIELPKGQREVCGTQQFIEQASFFGIICVDLYRLHRIVERVGGTNPTWDISGLAIGTFDAGLFGQNIALAAESLGYDIVFCGTCGDMSDKIIPALELPDHVFPLTGIAIGKGVEEPPIRPRLPTSMILHKGKYNRYSDEQLDEGIKQMSDELEKEGYYRKYTKRDNFLWSDHVKRKFGGKWLNDVEEKRLKYLKHQKFLDE